MEESLLFVYLVELITNFFSSAYSIALYVLGSLGMYTIAKRRGIEKPWLAWIPVASCWILGCISDQYRYVVKGENKSKRKLLLGFYIGIIACAVICLIICGVAIADLASMSFGYVDEEEMLISLMGSLGGILLTTIPMMVCAIVYSIFEYMAMYDLFTSCDPEHNVLFLVLSILFGIHPFFIFFMRKKDLGMPPRKQEPAPALPPQNGWQPPQQSWQPPQQNWQPPQQNWQPPQPDPHAPPANDGGETTIL